jgi:hypothetical protein
VRGRGGERRKKEETGLHTASNKTCMCVCNYYACIGNTILQLAEGIVADL